MTDCSQCQALCCVVLAFDRDADFAIDKPAGIPCPHLKNDRCRIHDRRAERGFAGCVRYDCGGAGSRACAKVDGHWSDSPATMSELYDVFYEESARPRAGTAPVRRPEIDPLGR
jgi:hypothetical protein